MNTPCDHEPFACPFAEPNDSTGLYFCRDMCGVGCDESNYEEMEDDNF